MQPKLNRLIISVEEARDILGRAGRNMTNEEIEDVILNLDAVAKDSLEMARNKLTMKRDATELAELIYDIYKDDSHIKRIGKNGRQ